jgi:uroporphyrinogen decarboxylase
MTAALKNDLLLRALAREPVPRTPVWLMRQAGRYLEEYRAARARAGSFMQLMSTPELACEVTLQPIDRFGFDAAILFSDILTIPHAMGCGLHFVEGEGPRFATPVRDRAAIDALPRPDPATELRYVLDAVALIRRELGGRVPLIGFAGSPWTLMTYMVEGEAREGFPRARAMLDDAPAAAHALLDRLARAVTDYLAAQVAHGAQALMIFDTWGGMLDAARYREFSLRYMQAIVEGLPREAEGRRVPVILFTKGGGAWLEAMADTGCDALGADWTTDLGEARTRVGARVALQGNLDPELLFAGPEAVRDGVARTLASFGPHPGHVFNLGHGIKVGTPVEGVQALVDAVRELSPAYRGVPPVM